jgi:hypothetical protein
VVCTGEITVRVAYAGVVVDADPDELDDKFQVSVLG